MEYAMKTPKAPVLKFKNQGNSKPVEKEPPLKKTTIKPDEALSKETKLPVLRFKNRRNNGKNVLYADCVEAEALFFLMRPRQYLEPIELSWVSKMGFSWEICGDKREFREEMIRIEANELDK
jgi:hypothetical protein